MTEPAACGLTVMRTIRHYRATKQFRFNPVAGQWAKVSYEAGAWFRPTEHRFHDLAGLMAVLDRVRADPCAFVVRGALTPETAHRVSENPDTLIRRRKHTKGGIDPSLAETPRRWLMIDIDNWPLPAMADLSDDPEGAIDAAIHELLPEAFRDAECWWQLSSSAGFVPGCLKVHLFFWLSEPATNAHLKAVLKQHAPGVDTAPFNAAQPHFIADPIVEGGHDPLPRRTGWRQGLEAVVVLPELRAETPRPRPVGTGAGGRVGDLEDALATLGHGEGGEGFHAPLRTATLRYARRCARYGERDDAAIKAVLRDAIRSAPVRPGGNVETPYCQDYYLDSLIEGAFALLAGDAEVQTMRPHHAAPGQTLEQGAAALLEHVGGFATRAIAWHRLTDPEQEAQPSEHSALVVSTGGGKSHAGRLAVAEYIERAGLVALAQAEEGRPKKERIPARVLWLVQHHGQAEEALDAFAAMGVSAAIMRGRERPDPAVPADPDEDKDRAVRMCLNLPAVQDALAAGYEVDSAACGKSKPGHPVCPFRSTCGYQQQKAGVKRADVVIATHDTLFHPLSKDVSGGIGLVVVDESWWQKGLKPNRTVRIDGFAGDVLMWPVWNAQPSKGMRMFRYKANDEKTGDLNDIAQLAVRAFEACEPGAFVSRAAVEKAGLTADLCHDAFNLEWERMRQGLVWPGMPEEQRKEGVQEAAVNVTLARRAGVWDALRELLRGSETHTGRLQVAEMADKNGPYLGLYLHSRSEVKAAVADLPLLLLDATMPVEIVRRFLPRLEVLAEVKIAAPHMEVTQVLGGFGKTSIVPSDKAAPQENRRREGMVGELRDYVLRHGRGDALVVTYLAIEDRFAELPGVRTGHFNAIAGLDEFKEARSAFIIGRPLPDHRALREQVLALTGKAIPLDGGRVETRGALMADGTGQAINVRCYADPDLEAMRVAITDAEVMQAIGRLRGVRRTADNPAAAFILADVALPLPVNRLVRWEDVRLNPVDRMQARGAVFTSPSDAAKAYPDLFPTQEGAKKALQRAGSGEAFRGHLPMEEPYLGECPRNRLTMVSYRPTGRGQQNRVSWVSCWRLEGFRGWLVELLGDLASYHVEAALPHPPPPDPDGQPEVINGSGPVAADPSPAAVLSPDPVTNVRASSPSAPEDAMADPVAVPEQPQLEPGRVYPRAGWVRHVPREVFTIRLRDGRTAEVMDGPDGRMWLEMPAPVVAVVDGAGAPVVLR